MAVFVIPVALGLVASLLLSRALPAPSGLVGNVFWWLALIAAVLAVVTLATAACRRFLPLAALLDLALLFPDRAPSRFALARRTGSVKQLAAEVEALHREAERPLVGHQERTIRAERILGLVAALSVHDARTRGHSERVRVYTDMLSEQLRLPEADRDRLRWASMLHDIGKLAVPADVLNKPGGLDDDEWETLHQHPTEGAKILSPLAGWLGEWVHAAEHHHEHWDGTGYPRGLKREQISRAGRIVAVADAYETMTASRPYRRALTPIAARRELVRASGTQFDPRIVRAFLEISVGRLWRAVGVEALIAEIPVAAPLVWITARTAHWGGNAAATAGAVAVLAVAGVVAAPVTVLPATNAIGQRSAPSSPASGDISGVCCGGAAAPAAKPAPAPPVAAPAGPAAPVVVTAVSAASQTSGSTTGTGGGSAPPPPPQTKTHGSSAFAPGHGYGPPPGQGGTPPGHLP